MTKKQPSVEEIYKDYVKRWDNGEFEWNHHEGDKLGIKPISPERIWQTFIEPTLQAERKASERAVREERERINKLMAMNMPQKSNKKTEAYNDGLISGWYAAKEFIRQTLTQPPTPLTNDKE